MAYENKDYVEVKDRIVEFRVKHPEGSLQSSVIHWPTTEVPFVAVEARAYRTPDDPTPGVGLAWETVPGKTNFTRDSEVQNAETSAWGRALIAMGAADAKKGIASADEVRNRRAAPEPAPQPPPADPRIIRGGPFKGQTVDDMAATEEGRAQLLVWIADPSIRPELAEAAATALDEHDNPVANGSGPVGAGADLQTTDEPEVGEGADKEPEEGTNAAPDPAEGSEPKMSAAQRAAIFGIAGDLEWSKEDIHAFAGIESIAALTKKQAGDLIDRMTLAEADQVREGA